MATSWATSAGSRAVMRANRRRDTRPELRLRRALHALGMRYRVDTWPIGASRLTADVVFGPAQVAVFVDGCFWHGCPEHYRRSTANREFWDAKVIENTSRDRRVDDLLRAAGWLPVRVWEHEDPLRAAELIAAIVRERRAPRTSK